MQLLVMWMLGLKALVGWTVNSPHLRNPEKAVIVSASKLRQSPSDEWVAAPRIHLSTSHVMGILGLHSLSHMYLLIPRMTCWSKATCRLQMVGWHPCGKT